MKYRYLIAFSLLILSQIPTHTLWAQQIEATRFEREFLGSNALEQCIVGYQLSELQSGKVISAFQADKLFMPASTLKVLYTLAAIEKLGSEYRYETKIKITGDVLSDGSLEGDLIIEASGDPSLGSGRFDPDKDLTHFLEAGYRLLKKNKINCIDGRLIILLKDRSNPVCGYWPWEDIGNYYGGGAWGFNFNENEYELEFQIPGKPGKLTRINSIDPFIPYLSIQNEVTSGDSGKGDQAYIFGGPYDYQKVIRGSLPTGRKTFVIRGAIPNPPLNFLAILQQYLENKGLYAEGIDIQYESLESKRTLGVYKSPSLIELARECNNESINLYSEAFGKLLLLSETGYQQTTYPSEEVWASVFREYNLADDFQISDACGLSPSNYISPATMNKFFHEMSKRMTMDQLLDVLPKNGKEGSVVSFITDRGYKDNLWLKSGSIAGVLNYTGIIKSSGKEQYYAFTIFTNHRSKKIKGAKMEIKGLIRYWMQNLD